MRTPRRTSYLVAAALIVVAGSPSSASPAPRPSAHPPTGPLVVAAPCPTAWGLGVASHPGPAVAVARRFLRAERGRTGESMWASADRWLRHRAAGGVVGFRRAFPRIGTGSPAWRFRTREPRWLDARFGPIGPYLNARLKLLAAGVQAYSCPQRLIHRFVRAIWWIQVILPRCDCDPDRILDLLIVRRDGRYRVFGLA